MTTPPPISAIERAIHAVGSQAELARRLGTTQARIWNWANRDKTVPAEVVKDIVRVTDGAVTAHDLAPEVFPEGFEFPKEAA